MKRFQWAILDANKNMLNNFRMQTVLTTLSIPGREADHSAPSSAEIKNSWTYTSALHISLVFEA
jgi:hypothetical protein